MRITQLSTLAKTAVGNADYLLTANNVNSANQKIKVSDLFPTLANSTATANTALLSSVSNKNEYTLSRFVAGSTKITVTGGGGTNDVSIDLGTVNFADISGSLASSQLAGAIDLTTKMKGILAIANGGTGSGSTTYCNLASNVTGTLPTGRGGTGLTSFTANGLFYASSTSAVGQLSAAGNGEILIGRTGDTPTWGNITSSDGSIAISAGSGTIGLSVATVPTFNGDITWTSGVDRYVKPNLATGSTAADKLYVQGGLATNGNGGDIWIQGGATGNASATAGKVYIAAGTGSSTVTDIIFRQNIDASTTLDVMKISGNKVGITNTAAAFTVDDSPLHVKNANSSLGKAVLRLEQDDTDEPFIRFKGTSASGASTASLATSTATAGAKYGAIRIAFDDKSSVVEKWIRIYDSAV